MISKELMSAVYPHGENSIEAIEFYDNELSVLYRMGGWKYYNVYELAHKCKEWAQDEAGVFVWSGWNVDDEMWSAMDGSQHINYFVADTEPEAVFKVCQWILDNQCEPNTK